MCQCVYIYHGSFVDAPVAGDLRIREDHVAGVDARGTIVFVVAASELKASADGLSRCGHCAACVTGGGSEVASGSGAIDASRPRRVHVRLATARGGEKCVLCPGFVDGHIHAPQVQYAGTALDLPLLRWLDRYAFPAEAGLQDLTLAECVYGSLVELLLRNGTTTALLFATIHLEPTKVLADACLGRGLRALVGKVCIDQHAPAFYCESTEQSLADTRAFIEYVRARSPDARLLQPVVTPRFIPTCSLDLLRGLGRLAAEHGCLIQSHISESDDEVAFVRALFPHRDGGDARDAPIFDECGLLTGRSVFAHGVQLREDECDLLRARGATIGHCPLSNFHFANGTLATSELLARGNRLCLGSDVAASATVSLLNSQQHAVTSHKARLGLLKLRATRQGDVLDLAALESGERTRHGGSGSGGWAGSLPERARPFNWKHAFHMATQGGAEGLSLGDSIGTIDVGKQWDVLQVNVDAVSRRHAVPVPDRRRGQPGGDDGPFGQTLEDRFQAFLNLGGDREIMNVWVDGRHVSGTIPV